VATITQIDNLKKTSRDIRAENLVRETKVLNIARLAKMLVDLFGLDEPYKKIGKREGEVIEMHLVELDGYITFVLTSDRQNFDCRVEKSNNPVARIIINVEEEKILSVLSSIIRSKSNIFGLMKLLKYLIPRKIKIKGSYVAAIKLVRCLMIGKNEVYKNSKGDLLS
jgi:hypothetical protein